MAAAIWILGTLVAGPTVAGELQRAWTRDFLPPTGSYRFKTACSSPRGDLLTVVAAGGTSTAASIAILVDAKGNATLRELSRLGDRSQLADVMECLATGDGYLLVGRSGNDNLEAKWLGADLEPEESVTLLERKFAQVWALTATENGRFAAALDHGYAPSILLFDRKNVVHVRPPWSGDKARLLYDVMSVGDTVIACGLEGERGQNPANPSFDGAQILVSSFALDGSERKTIRLPGYTCRLFRDRQGRIVLLHQSSSDPRSGLRLTRLDRDLQEIEARTALDRISFMFKLQAVLVGESIVVLNAAFPAPALDLVEADGNSRMELDVDESSSVALRAGGDRIYLISHTSPSDSRVTGLRVDSLEVRANAIP